MKLDIYKFYGYISYLNYILWLLELNLAVCIVNIPLLLVLFLGETTLLMIPLVFLAGIPLGLSLYAAFCAMPGIEDGVIKAYISGLKRGSWRVCRAWTPIWAVLCFVFADLMLVSHLPAIAGLKWPLAAALCVFICFAFNFLILWSRWPGQSALEALHLTGKLSFVKSLRYYLNLMILVGVYVLLSSFPIYLAMYGIGIGLFLAWKNFVPVMEFVESRPENAERSRLNG